MLSQRSWFPFGRLALAILAGLFFFVLVRTFVPAGWRQVFVLIVGWTAINGLFIKAYFREMDRHRASAAGARADEVKRLLAKGDQLGAIRVASESANLGLTEAKTLVEVWAQKS